ncbi:transporter substrate-binding domain-containing protein [Miniphocaeibacter halophilus]|uniref:Transporter substrate-binding domain-containing protein n=1 Tax=Miniphocaeibacter halophilus TaxID=2931922 RepID=A0AC61MRL8_9FIRM|nr:transporter substrate-binding domain-containing protein [Miniphocaeibacter halophilus]QQK07099.1 transporter substrate-binding domain-containing protein [Miniphocaeibacter halophilus]
MKKKILALLLIAAFTLTACEKVEKTDTSNSTTASKEEVTEATTEKTEVTEKALAEMREAYEVSVDDLKAEDYPEDSTMHKILTDKKLIVATNAAYPPYEYRLMVEGKSEFGGIDMEMARLLAKKMDVELEIVDTSFDSLIAGLQSGMYDLLLAGMNKDPEREKQVDFTSDYYFPTLVLLVREADLDKYKTEKDIPDDFKFGNQMGTVQENVTNAHFPNAKDNSLYLKNYPDLTAALESGQIDGLLVEDIIAKAFIAQNPKLAISEGISYPGETGFAGALKKDDKDFQDYLNTFIKEIQDNGTFDKIVIDSNELAGVAEESSEETSTEATE